ncbi:MAG: hypothetical protein HQQ73_00355 [Desulfobulbaceae bacterium]|nr:hypothetical protein [Desulfobulbaceae bacterium]
MKKRLLPLGIALGVAALVLYAAVYFAYQWLGSRLDAVLGPNIAPQQAETGRSGQESGTLLTHEAAIQQILAHNIFKAALEGKGTTGQDWQADKLAASGGPLELLGTVSGSAADARAIIRAGKEEQEQIYRLGDTVLGAEIVQIGRGRVVLTTSAGPELLLLKERENNPVLPPGRADASMGLEEGQLLSPLSPQGLQGSPEPQEAYSIGGRTVPQALPGRRVNTTGSVSRSNHGETAGGVPVRTGAAALQPLEVPWEEPGSLTQPSGANH